MNFFFIIHLLLIFWLKIESIFRKFTISFTIFSIGFWSKSHTWKFILLWKSSTEKGYFKDWLCCNDDKKNCFSCFNMRSINSLEINPTSPLIYYQNANRQSQAFFRSLRKLKKKEVLSKIIFVIIPISYCQKYHNGPSIPALNWAKQWFLHDSSPRYHGYKRAVQRFSIRNQYRSDQWSKGKYAHGELLTLKRSSKEDSQRNCGVRNCCRGEASVDRGPCGEE